ncbi:E3 ubiquitin-protein ligase TRIM56-like [Babylonia areolata]|uniref:E3 ubiquitin-protein ligase TRIM56-like n=1 Tax=Babylonia areolata TaxID=304850 RepID=UPI003FD168F4
MAAKPSNTDLECPVCHVNFQEPKILPCTHLVCRKCVVRWLSKDGSQAGCPLCRVAILSSTPAKDGDLDTLVDALPTDLAILSVIENQKVLSSPHFCAVCDGNITASAYCLQCNMKLCQSCTKGHTKIPHLQSHVIEALDTITAERLAGTCRMMCKSHPDRLVELYCDSHQELICMQCFLTSHRHCPEVKAVTDIAQQKRAELKQIAAKLLKKEAKLSAEIQASKNAFKTCRKKVKDIFEDLEHLLRKRCQTLMDAIQAEEEANTLLAGMERKRASLKAHAGMVTNLASSAGDDAMLDMMGKLKPRLQDLEGTLGTGDGANLPVMVTLNTLKLNQLKDAISGFGEIRKVRDKPASPMTASISRSMEQDRPVSPIVLSPTGTDGSSSAIASSRGEKPATELKPGDIVRRGAGWMGGEVDGRGAGTVVSRFIKLDEGRVLSMVKVKWDNTGAESSHRMEESVIELERL